MQNLTRCTGEMLNPLPSRRLPSNMATKRKSHDVIFMNIHESLPDFKCLKCLDLGGVILKCPLLKLRVDLKRGFTNVLLQNRASFQF